MYITDTHPLIYYAAGQRNKLSKKALRFFTECAEGRNTIYVPAVVLWESSILLKLNKVKIKSLNFEEWCNKLFRSPNFVFLPIKIEHILRSHHLDFHKDSFDLLIVATAKVLDMPLITKDSVISDANIVEVVW